MKKFLLLLLIVGCSTKQHTAVTSKEAPGFFAAMNGYQMYYELHGKTHGTPLVLIHGGGSDMNVTFGRILPILAKNHRIIAVDERAHGRSTDNEQPLKFETSADDISMLMNKLKIEKADVMGFSNGASTALQIAIRHPKLVRKLVFISSMTKKSGAHDYLWNFIKQTDFSNMPQALKDAYLRVTPDANRLRNMHDKDAARMKAFQNVSDKELKTIQAETLLVAGDRDVVRPEHVIELSHLIPQSRVLIVPGTHGEAIGELLGHKETSPPVELTAGLIETFLK